MSKELKKITENIMDQIHDKKIKMRPKIYFIAGSVLTFVGLVSSIIISVFLIGLIRFSLRTHGPIADYRLDQILSSFPWWAPVFALIGLTVGIWLLRKYDFSFKINFKIIIIGFILTVFASGWIIDSIGLNDLLIRRGPMQGIMRQHNTK
ncbi:MAG: hypothetical protein WC657_01930 [Candidatus Paceibacterota bacterium]|jgi:hypothetical protein